eukprot:snap_masked-scaffold_27-processed-gene-4.27-mRNA-1 protein AED:1.00 eAED:1.00 QI:0/-1/0/0/-1/1/1/0/103
MDVEEKIELENQAGGKVLFSEMVIIRNTISFIVLGLDILGTAPIDLKENKLGFKEHCMTLTNYNPNVNLRIKRHDKCVLTVIKREYIEDMEIGQDENADLLSR